MSHPSSRAASGASSPAQHHGPLLPPVSPRPPSGPRSAIRPQSAMRMGLLGAIVPAASASASAAASASGSARGGPRQPWAGHLVPASPSVLFMARHSSAASSATENKQPSWTLDPKRAASMTSWIEETRAFLKEPHAAAATANTNAAAAAAAAPSADAALPASALEGLALSLALRLLPNLAHHSPAIRGPVAHLLLKLGCVFDDGGQAVGRNAAVDEIMRTRATAVAATQQQQQQQGIKRASSTTGSSSSDSTRQSSLAQSSSAAADRMQAIVECILAEPDLSSSLRLFFTLMGANTLSPLVLSLVERLESSYTHGSPTVREASILIAGALMRSHLDMFRAQGAREGLVGVWNLFFLLDWMSGGERHTAHAAHAEARGGGSESLAKLGGGSFSDALSAPRLPLSGARVCLIEGLGLVCDLYVESNVSLALQIVSRLLRLPDKTQRETRAVKNAVLSIGNACIAQALAITNGTAAASSSSSAVAGSAAAAASASRAASPALDNATSFAAFSAAVATSSPTAAAAATAASYSLYPTLLSTLSAHREEHLDLLGWATFAYTVNVQNAQWNLHMSAAGSIAGSAAARSGSAAAATASAAVHAPRPIVTDSRDIDALYFSFGSGSSSGSGSGGSTGGRSAAPLLRPSVEYPVDTLLRESSTIAVSLPVELSEFLSSLESHLRASPPLIRLGAAQALQSLLKIYPSALAWGAASAPASVAAAGSSSAAASAARQALLFPHIVWGCADESHAVSATYVAILADIARGVGNRELQRAIARYQSTIVGDQRHVQQRHSAVRSLASMPASLRESPQSSRPASSSAATSAADETDPPSLLSVLSLAISLAPPVPSRFLAFVLNSLGSLRTAAAGASASHQMLVLQLVAEWAARLQEVEPVFVAKLLPVLMGEEAEITAAAAADHALLLNSAAASSAGSSSLSSHPFAAEMSCTVLRMLKRLCAPPSAPLHASLAPHHLLALTSWAMGVLARAPGTEQPHSEGSAAAEESMDDDTVSVAAPSLSRYESQALEQRIVALLDLLPCLPLERLPAPRIEALLSICLGRLLNSPSSAVRAALYSFLSSSGTASVTGSGSGSVAAPKWLLSSKQLLSRACGILLAGLGDTSSPNVSLALSGLLALISQMHLSFASNDSNRDGRHCLLAESLRKAREPLLIGRSGLLERLVAYDALARCFALPSDGSSQVALTSIRECVTSAEFAPFASRLLSSAGAAAPQSLYAHWWALLLTHCGHSIRRQVPVLLLLPLLGLSVDPADPPLGSANAVQACSESMRAATTHTIKRACILVGGLCHERLVSELVSSVLPRMLDAASGAVANAAGYDLMAVLAPLRLKGLSAFLIRRYLAPALQLLPSSSLAPSVRRAVMLCVESWVMLHPKLCFPYLENLRNALREMLCHGSGVHTSGGGGGRAGGVGEKHAGSNGSQSHLTLLCRLYTLVCFTSSLHAPLGSSSVADNYFAYLRADLAALSGAEERATFGASAAAAAAVAPTADPLLSSLTSSQLRIVTVATLQALGCMDGAASRALAPAALDELLRFLAHPDASTRFFAAEALAIQMDLVTASSPSGSTQQIALVKWTLLPLIADPDPAVRLMVVAGCGLGTTARGSSQAQVQNPARRRMARMMPEEDDAFEAAVTTPVADVAAASSSSAAAKPAKLPKGKKGAAAAAAASAAQSAPVAFVLPQGIVADSGVAAILSRVDSEDPWYAEEDSCIVGCGSGADFAVPAVPSITPAFHRALSSVIRSRIEVFPSPDRFDELLYLLNSQSSALRGSQVPGVVALVLGELCIYNLGSEWGERCEGVVRSLLLSLEALVTPLNKPLIFGSVLALQSLACSRVCRAWSAELQPVSLLFAHLADDDASGLWLREGQLVALAAIVSEPKVDLRAVDPAAVESVTQKLMKTLKEGSAHSLSSNSSDNIAPGSSHSSSIHSTPRAQQLSLEILAALCEKVDDLSAVSAILGYLFEILAGSADASFHEACSVQLRKLFASLPEDHALLETFAEALAIDVKSARLESRLRALTTLVILGPRLASGPRTQSFLRLLADPDRSVKHHALAVLLNPTMGLSAETNALAPVVKAMIREMQQQQQQQQQPRPSPSQSPQPGASPADKKSSLLAAAAASKKPQEKQRSGSAASASSARDVASTPLEDLSDQQLLRLLEDVSDSYERRAVADALATTGGFRAHSSNTSHSTATSHSAVQAPSISAVDGAAAADATHPLLSIPLADSDPFNLRLHRSPAWVALLKAYGLPASSAAVSAAASAGMSAEEWERHAALAGSRDLLASFQQLTADSSASAAASSSADPVLAPDAETDSPTMLDRLPASKRHELMSMVRAKQVAHLDFAPLVAALLRLDAGKAGESVAAELLAHFQALSREEEGAIDAAAVAAASAPSSKPASAAATKTTTKSFVLGSASDSAADYPPLDLVSKLHDLGVALNLLAGFRASATGAGVSVSAAGGGAAAAFVSNAVQAEREAFGSKLASALTALQAAGTRFKSYAESLRARSLRALSNLMTFRAPGAATKWRHTATPRSERDFQRREAYINVVMNQPVDDPSVGTGAKSKQQQRDEDAMPQTKQGLLEMQRDLERDINDWATQLGRVSSLQIAVVRSISKLLSPAVGAAATASLSSDLPPLDSEVASATFLWLGAMFADTHRGVRVTVREGIVALVAAQCPAAQSSVSSGKPSSASARASPPPSVASESPFLLQVQRSIYTLFHSLRDCAAPPLTVEGGHLLASSGPSTAWLYNRRARADLVYLLGRLVVFSAHARLRSDALSLLVGLWADADPAVRSEAIDAVHAMLRDRVPETMMERSESPAATADGSQPQQDTINAASGGSTSRASPSLMKSILGRLRDAEYGDKEKLSQLLNSYFVG